MPTPGLSYAAMMPAEQSADAGGSELDSLTPEQLQQLASLGSLDERGQQLQDQIARAQALRGQSLASQHQSPIGAAMGSLADILNSGRANTMEQQAVEAQHANQGQQAAGRSAYMMALAKALRGHQTQPQFASAPGDFNLPANGEGVA
jgi:transcription elongation GreA/GreB family factor